MIGVVARGRKGETGRNPLAGGFYTVSEAARLIEGGSQSRIRGWLQGYSRNAIAPLLSRDYDPIDGRQELSFLDLIEIRFVEHFRFHRVKPRTLRIAQESLRKRLQLQHPFASGKVLLEADRADVCIVEMRGAAEQTRDMALLSLTTDNFVMRAIIEQNLVPGLEFDEKSKSARQWAPRLEKFPSIIVDPYRNYGQPSLPNGHATKDIYIRWKAEAEDVDAVAYWTGLRSTEIDTAIRFEQCLDDGIRH